MQGDTGREFISLRFQQIEKKIVHRDFIAKYAYCPI